MPRPFEPQFPHLYNSGANNGLAAKQMCDEDRFVLYQYRRDVPDVQFKSLPRASVFPTHVRLAQK